MHLLPVQICCHPSLIKSMIDEESKAAEGIEQEDLEEEDLITKLSSMSIAKMGKRNDKTSSHSGHGHAAPEDDILNINSNPVFDEKNCSSKIKTVLQELSLLHEKYRKSRGEEPFEKAVIVSQWTSMLAIVKKHIVRMGLVVAEINGTVPVKSRGDIVQDFNRKQGRSQVMLLSLGAGGVGLNLVGANHLFLLDMHWNPQLESQVRQSSLASISLNVQLLRRKISHLFTGL